MIYKLKLLRATILLRFFNYKCNAGYGYVRKDHEWIDDELFGIHTCDYCGEIMDTVCPRRIIEAAIKHLESYAVGDKLTEELEEAVNFNLNELEELAASPELPINLKVKRM